MRAAGLSARAGPTMRRSGAGVGRPVVVAQHLEAEPARGTRAAPLVPRQLEVRDERSPRGRVEPYPFHLEPAARDLGEDGVERKQARRPHGQQHDRADEVAERERDEQRRELGAARDEEHGHVQDEQGRAGPPPASREPGAHDGEGAGCRGDEARVEHDADGGAGRGLVDDEETRGHADGRDPRREDRGDARAPRPAPPPSDEDADEQHEHRDPGDAGEGRTDGVEQGHRHPAEELGQVADGQLPRGAPQHPDGDRQGEPETGGDDPRLVVGAEPARAQERALHRRRGLASVQDGRGGRDRCSAAQANCSRNRSVSDGPASPSRHTSHPSSRRAPTAAVAAASGLR